MNDNRFPSKNPASEGSELKESFSAVGANPKHPQAVAASLNPWSAEAKERRKTLIAEINAGWSEESERALSALAEQLLPKG